MGNPFAKVSEKALAQAMSGDQDDKVRQIAALLMEQGQYYDPLEPSNFDEAIGETLAAFPANPLSHTLAISLRAGTPVNNLLVKMTNDYWFKLAESAAEDYVEDKRREARESAEEARAERIQWNREFASL